MIIEDYHNWTPEKCKDKIRTYQQNKDVYTRDLLLAKFDKYLGYIIYGLRKRYSYLRGERLQELYHTAILGFYKAMDVFDCTLPSKMIFLVIRSYVRNELDVFYAYKAKEHPSEDLLVNFEDLKYGPNKKKLDVFFDRCTITLLLSHPILKPVERDILDGMYCQGLSRKELAQSSGYTERTVRFYLGEALKKIRRVLRRTGEIPQKKVKKKKTKPKTQDKEESQEEANQAEAFTGDC